MKKAEVSKKYRQRWKHLRPWLKRKVNKAARKNGKKAAAEAKHY